MGKVAQVLIAGYWPDRVPRRIGVPQVPIAKLLDRAVGRAPDALALLSDGISLSHAELHAEAGRYTTGIAQKVPPNGSLGILEPSLASALVLTVAGFLAGCKVSILDASAPELVGDWAASARFDLLVASEDLAPRVVFDGEVTTPKALRASGAEAPTKRPARWREVAVRVPSGKALVGHSHVGVSAMVTNLTTYIPELAELDLAHDAPLSRWDGLAGAMTALVSGRGLIVGAERASGGFEPREAYGILTREQADLIVQTGSVPAHLAGLRLLFVCVDDFSVKWRRRLEDVLDRVVLPLWGAPETGPALAAHPSWAPLEIHGLPLVNVTLIPIDPTTREPSDVPWEMLTRAELGVESPSVMVEAGGPELAADLITVRGNAVVRTGKVVTVDRLGLVRFDGN